MKKHIFVPMLAALVAAMPVAAQENLTFAYASKNATVVPFGSLRNDTYDVAIALTTPSVYGMSITKIEVPVLPCAQVSDLSAWLSTSLRLEQQGSVKVNVPDQSYPLSMPTEGEGLQWVSLDLDEPYTIPNGGVYVGYSFTVSNVDASDTAKYPVAAAAGVEPGSFYLHTTRTYKTWADRSEELNEISMLQVTLQGGSMPANAARLGDIPFKYVAVGSDNKLGVMVYNIGTEPIASLGYVVKAADKEMTATRAVEPALPATFGYGEPLEFTLPELTSEGPCEVSLCINAVNGEPYAGEEVKGKVQVALFVPKHNAIVEEYTGMWCGNCPRGFAAMEEMNKRYPDFIGIAYHNQDNIAMEVGDPGQAEGYPMAVIDRIQSVDPYYADPSVPTFSLPQVWEGYCAEFTPVAVEVEAEWDEESKTVTAKSTINWATVPSDAETANYRMEYVLVADGLTNPRWYQTNYYANGAKGYPEYMDEFTHGGDRVRGLVFNDVAMMVSGFKGVSGSIPAIAVGEPTSYTYTFDTTEAYTFYGDPFPFLADKLRVVAIVLKGNGVGSAVNAAKCDVSAKGGIGAVDADKQVVGQELYNLNGQKVSRPAAGAYLQVLKYSDGSAEHRKLIIK